MGIKLVDDLGVLVEELTNFQATLERNSKNIQEIDLEISSTKTEVFVVPGSRRNQALRLNDQTNAVSDPKFLGSISLPNGQ